MEQTGAYGAWLSMYASRNDLIRREGELNDVSNECERTEEKEIQEIAEYAFTPKTEGAILGHGD